MGVLGVEPRLAACKAPPAEPPLWPLWCLTLAVLWLCFREAEARRPSSQGTAKPVTTLAAQLAARTAEETPVTHHPEVSVGRSRGTRAVLITSDLTPLLRHGPCHMSWSSGFTSPDPSSSRATTRVRGSQDKYLLLAPSDGRLRLLLHGEKRRVYWRCPPLPGKQGQGGCSREEGAAEGLSSLLRPSLAPNQRLCRLLPSRHMVGNSRTRPPGLQGTRPTPP